MSTDITDNNSQSGVGPLNKLLAKDPQRLRPFLLAVRAELPKEFTVISDGISRKGSRAPLCWPFRVKNEITNPKKTVWWSTVEILNRDGDIIECVLPWDVLSAKPREAIGMLTGRGLKLFEDYHRDTVLSLIRNWPVPDGTTLTAIDRVGWMEKRDAFALPSGRVLTRDGASEQYHFAGKTDEKEKGDPDTWKAGPGALARGNPYLTFGCAVAFSAPLLPFVPGSGSVIYHFYGKTSQGKTRILRTAQTVWPRVGLGVKSWKATDNGLEAEISRANNISLSLDELPKKPTMGFGNVIYMLANGEGKGRADKDGSNKERQNWQSAVLSTSEHSSAKVLQAIEDEQHGGQTVRMFDIPVAGAHGVFDSLHGQPTSRAFVKLLDKRIATSAGSAGAAFVLELLRRDDIEERLEAEVEKAAAALQELFGIDASDPSTNEVCRVLDSFALVAVAGEWATEFGITGWEPGEVMEAVRVIVQLWRNPPEEDVSDDQKDAVTRTRDALRRDGEGYMDLSVAESLTALPAELPGLRDADYFYVLSDAFEKIHPTHTRAMARHLEDAKYLVRGTEGSSLQYKMPPKIPGRPRPYRILRSILQA